MSSIICPSCSHAFTPNYPGRVCCSRECATKLRGSFEKRFWARVKKGRGCWEWQGRIEAGGYARIRREDRSRVFVHRVVWELENGLVPDGLLVLHKCDNRKCVRPDHLFLGTHQDNTDDMFAKGRANKAKGEHHGRAKLTEESVCQILKLAAAGGVTQTELAAQYGVHLVTVNKIVKGHRWAHLQQG